jgi:hypothetical protein
MWTDLDFNRKEYSGSSEYGVPISGKLDPMHDETEFGYIYCVDGKTMVLPIIYPNDHIYVNGVEVTDELRKPYVLSDELVRRIEEALADSGIYIDLP